MTKKNLENAGTFALGDRTVRRLGYGAMQLAGPGAFGPPRDRAEALALLREAVDHGVDHLDTSDIYGPSVTNALIREALHPYPEGLVLATKVGATRGPGGSWEPAFTARDLVASVHDNLRNLAVDALDVVYLRVMFDPGAPTEGSIEQPLAVLEELRRAGKIRHLGLSNVTATQVAEGRSITTIACVQNHYSLVHRADDDLVDALAADGIAYVPFFPLGGYAPIQSAVLAEVATSIGATPSQVALAWLLRRSPNLLLIPGTSRVAHLRENLASADVVLPDDALARLDAMIA